MLDLVHSLGTAAIRVTDLGSSHGWTLHRALLEDGREVFVKAAPDHAKVIAAEAAGLRWLAAARAVPVPDVLAARDGVLVLPWLEGEVPTAEAAERFGRDLAALHLAGAPEYGAPWAGYIAELPLDNTHTLDWATFYGERRLLPYLQQAADRGRLGPAEVRLVETVIGRLAELAGPPEPPSRIHGDLWSGNLLWSGGRVHLIDPAAHGGHRETDLAMLEWFGAPHLDRMLAAYTETAPLAEGRRDRIALHQLHPLLVHVVLFGGSYRESLVAAARQSLRAA